MMRTAIVIGLSLVLLSCATKHYGRQGIPLRMKRKQCHAEKLILNWQKCEGLLMV